MNMTQALPDEVVLSDGYNSVRDIAEKVVEKTAEAQDVPVEELETVPVTAIDEAEMPEAIENSKEVSQETWDLIRSLVQSEVNAILN